MPLFCHHLELSVAEYGIETLSRSASSRFLARRYEYLSGNEIPSHLDVEDPSIYLHKELNRVDVDYLVEKFGVDFLNSALIDGLENIRGNLAEKLEPLIAETNIDNKKIQQLLDDLSKQYSEAEIALADKVLGKLGEFRNKTIAAHRAKLEDSITNDLTTPIPIGLIIEQLEAVIGKIVRERELIHKKRTQRKNRSAHKTLTSYFSQYLLLHSQRLNLEKNKWAWAAFSIVACIGVTPILFDLARRLPNIWPPGCSAE